jgi:hypothetical protein
MLMTIRYESGLRVEAVVLTADRERMRVAIDTQVDTTELRQVDACWHMEDGSEVEIEALIPITDASGFWSAVPLTNTAGHGFMVA